MFRPIITSAGKDVIRCVQFARREADSRGSEISILDILLPILLNKKFSKLGELQLLGLSADSVREFIRDHFTEVDSNEPVYQPFWYRYFRRPKMQSDASNAFSLAWERCWNQKRRFLSDEDLLFGIVRSESSLLQDLMNKLEISKEQLLKASE